MKLYRYNQHVFASTDDEYYSISTYSNITVDCTEYEVIRETKCYYHCEYGKRIRKTGKNRYAFPTKEEALYNFIKRKEKQIEILNYNLKIATIGLSEAIAQQKKGMD